MIECENSKVLTHLKELEEQLEAVNQKFKQVELELSASGQSLEQLYLGHKNRLELADQKRVSENLFHQLTQMQHEFANIQNGVVWFAMQMAFFFATLKRVASFVASERDTLEAKKRHEQQLQQKTNFYHLRAKKNLEEQQRLEEMAEKARTYPYPSPLHLTPYRTWPY